MVDGWPNQTQFTSTVGGIIKWCGAALTSASLNIALIDPAALCSTVSNQPIGGAVVELINAATNGPATVFLTDGVTPAPILSRLGLTSALRGPVRIFGEMVALLWAQ